MASLDRITEFHGRLSDLRAVWWPFLFLKPESPAIPITWRRMLVMVVCFASWLLIGWLVWNFRSLTAAKFFKAYAIMLLAFAGWFNLVTAPLWNRRARLLAGENRGG